MQLYDQSCVNDIISEIDFQDKGFAVITMQMASHADVASMAKMLVQRACAEATRRKKSTMHPGNMHLMHAMLHLLHQLQHEHASLVIVTPLHYHDAWHPRSDLKLRHHPSRSCDSTYGLCLQMPMHVGK